MVSLHEGTYLRHSSTIFLCVRAAEQHITHRSWLKLLKIARVSLYSWYDRRRTKNLSITNIPDPSGPSVFSTGTFTSSKAMKAVPAVGE